MPYLQFFDYLLSEAVVNLDKTISYYLFHQEYLDYLVVLVALQVLVVQLALEALLVYLYLPIQLFQLQQL
jgi:hypothetical protein